MSAATWRSTFTFNKYSQITAGAVRKSLKETQRLAAEKRGLTSLRYQVWENGKGGEQVRVTSHCWDVSTSFDCSQITLDPTQESDPKNKTAAV
ncbi:mitochondrial ATP synthase epsilon chain-domain-containing protein [Lentinula novae-zelandiae]|nr:mitochondrial ATP synthase epsilon chain-domain-containing protein [Lentinula novae-zelandiae]